MLGLMLIYVNEKDPSNHHSLSLKSIGFQNNNVKGSPWNEIMYLYMLISQLSH